MTECERIVKSGRLKKEFLEEEYRNDFLVDVERKKLWMISLDLLLEFDEVCRRHNLTYFLAGGTLLGAIRHHGFVPWDDDVDVYMLRDDFERLPLYGDDFKHPYFFESPYTDPGYCYSPLRIRNSNTTAIVEKFAYEKFNQGIWLSIFPIDKWVLKEGEEKYNEIKKLLIDCGTCMRMSNPNLEESDKLRVENYTGLSYLENYEKIHSIASQYKDVETNYVANMICSLYPYKCMVYRSEAFQSVVYKKFEGFVFPVPVGYDHILSTAYGDYMTFPPIDKRGTWHYGRISDPDKPYTEYLKSINV